MRLSRVAATLVLASAALPSPARAQPGAESDRRPPRLIALAPLELERDQLPERVDSIDATVVVELDGTASLATCDAPAAACAAITDALTRAQFEPARVGDAPVRARVSVRFALAEEDVEDEIDDVAPPADPIPSAAPPAAPEIAPDDASPPADEPSFRAEGRVARVPAGARRFEVAEVRDVPGAFGDPFRAIDALPGVVAPIVGLPFYYVRGAPPTGNLYAYDDIPLPILFHLGIGPSTIHPRMLGPLRFHAGAAPARYGRLIGGVIAGEGPEAGRLDDIHSEVELRLLDINGYVETPLEGGGDVRAAMRIGWPGVVASLALPGLELFYGDYQLRASLPMGRDEFTLVSLGSYDRFAFPDNHGGSRVTEIQFHRLEGRWLRRMGPLQLGAALRLGYDRSHADLDDDFRASTEGGSAGPRLWLAWSEGWVSVRAGADFNATFGAPELSTAPQLGAHHTRSVGGAYAEVLLALDPTLTLELGARIDVWARPQSADLAAEPRVRVAWTPVPELELHVAAGMAHQPAVPTLAVPGFADLAVPDGLQRSLQAEAGGRVRYGSFEAELQLFAHRYERLIYAVPYLASEASQEFCDVGERDDCLRYEGGSTAHAWGGEVFLRIAPTERLSGWISYTLAWAESDPVFGEPYRPEFDVRHVLSGVARWDIGLGFSVSARVSLRAGEYTNPVLIQEDSPGVELPEVELPPFFRADAQVAYQWDAGWARLRVSLEWMNLTLARQPLRVECNPSESGPACATISAAPIFAPNLGIRAEM